jgi:DNA-binding transcriptional regulator YiaG
MIIAEKPKPAVIEEEPLEDDNDSDHKNFEQSSDEDEEESKKEPIKKNTNVDERTAKLLKEFPFLSPEEIKEQLKQEDELKQS